MVVYKKLIVLVCAIGFGLVLVEVVLRIVNYPYIGCDSIDEVSECRSGRFDPELGWSYKNNNTSNVENAVYIINEEGYRVGNIQDKTDFSKKIVLIVGNSVIFGHGINYIETFGYKLSQRLGDGYQVINMAVQGYGLDQAYIRLKQVMEIYNPSHVIVDFIDDYDSRNANRDRRSLFPCNVFSGTKPVFSIIDNELVLKYKPVKYENYDSPKILLLWKMFNDVMAQKSKNNGDLTKKIYLEMNEYVKKHNSKMLVVNYWSEIRDYQKNKEISPWGIASVSWNESKFMTLKGDYFHPNSDGTSLMLDRFIDAYSNVF